MEEQRSTRPWVRLATLLFVFVVFMAFVFFHESWGLSNWSNIGVAHIPLAYVWLDTILGPSPRTHRYAFAIVFTLMFGAIDLLAVDLSLEGLLSDWLPWLPKELWTSVAFELVGAAITFLLFSIVWDVSRGREDRHERAKQHAELLEKVAALEAKLDARAVSLEAALEALRRSEEED